MTQYAVMMFMSGGMDSHFIMMPRAAADKTAFETARSDILADVLTSTGGDWTDPLVTLDWSPTNAADFPGQSWAAPPEFANHVGMFNGTLDANPRDCSIIPMVGRVYEEFDPAPGNAPFEGGRTINDTTTPGQIQAHNTSRAAFRDGTTEPSGSGYMARLTECLLRKNGNTSPSNTRSFSAFMVGQQDRALLSREYNGHSVVGGEKVPGRTGVTINGAGAGISRTEQVADWLNNGAASAAERAQNGGVNYAARKLSASRLVGEAFATAYEEIGSTVTINFTLSSFAGFENVWQRILEIIEINEQQPSLLGSPAAIVFTAQVPFGYDHHRDMGSEYPTGIARLDGVVGSVRSALLGIPNNPAVGSSVYSRFMCVNATDFNRTGFQNSRGTDHARGQNILVWGGAVDGGKIYGDVMHTWDDAVASDPWIYDSRFLVYPLWDQARVLAPMGVHIGLTEQEVIWGVNPDGTPGSPGSPADVVPFPSLQGTVHSRRNYSGTTSKLIPYLV